METVDPLTALLVFTAVVLAGFVLLRPGVGWLWRWLRSLVRDERVLVEDALKHVQDYAYHQKGATAASLAGALGISADRAATLLGRMGGLGLVKPAGEELELTAEGRSQALAVIRMHRLWERYLAERTSLPEREWHTAAELQEHKLTPEQADALDARLNYPRYDPHGDPIPTPGGELPPYEQIPLTELAPGRPARVVHLEDEPEAVYSQLVAVGLQPGIAVQVIEAAPQRIRFWVQGTEQVLSPLVAAQVAVTPVPRSDEQPAADEARQTLLDLAPGDRGRVLGIGRACLGVERQRLLDLGVVPGTVIECQMASPFGDPTAYRIRGAAIALRREQARLIQIDPVAVEEAVR